METMRIGQLARKLDITPTQIIKYLDELGIDVDKGVNTKLVKAGIDKVIDEFGTFEMPEEVVEPTSPVEEVIENETKEVPEHEIDTMANAKEEEAETAVVPEEPVEENTIEDDVQEVEESNIEVIRPEYVKLQGLKVVDKIDLPEPKPKKQNIPPTTDEELEIEPIKEDEKVEKAPEEESHIITEAQIKADLRRHYDEERKKTRKPKPKPKPRKKRTPLTYEQKLARERQQAERQKLAHDKRQKELKKKKYVERMKSVQPIQVKKSKPKKKEEPIFPVKKKYQKQPTSLWGKFMKWLNT